MKKSANGSWTIERKASANGSWTMERKTLCALLVMAWAWILGFLGAAIWYLQKSQAPVRENYSLKTTFAHEWRLLPKTFKPITGKNPDYESPLVIFTCNRANYLEETLTDVYNYLPTPCRFGCPVIVSQDGYDPEVTSVIKNFKMKFENKGVPFLHIQHRPARQRDVDQSRMNDESRWMDESGWMDESYQLVAKHYGWALKSLFHGQIDGLPTIPQRVMVLEEDIHIAPDFFDYFQATSKILDEDPSLFAVSAFSDNGHMVKDPTRLLRSDFFPGLGWMMNRRLWMDELDSKWPAGYWDDWLREPAQRQDRQVIRPEISRTYHFGIDGGASQNQFGSILESVKLCKQAVDWKRRDLSYLHEQAYNAQYADLIKSSRLPYTWEDPREALKTVDVRLEYQNFEHFQRLAQRIHIMDDEKAMVPRTAYHGVVETRPFGKHLLFLTPPMTQLKQNFPTLE
jgi:alpha-1,3-mannosyl-glycoprotein beta-1,2-N-acetylglucosaminyltransferase